MILQAGDSEEGREFAAASADAIFSRHAEPEAGRAFLADVKGRLARYGRAWDDLKILPAATYVLGDTDAEAAERAEVIRSQQVSPQTAIVFAEQLWNTDLSDRDPDGPLPEFDPVEGELVSKGAPVCASTGTRRPSPTSGAPSPRRRASRCGRR